MLHFALIISIESPLKQRKIKIDMAKKLFTKGQPKAPTAGRKKGTPNKKTVEVNDLLNRAMNVLANTLEQDVSAVNSSRRLQLFTDLFNYLKPKLSATSNKNEDSVNHSGEVIITVNFDGQNIGNSKGVDLDEQPEY
jgi:hypothetical protein